MCKSKQHVFTEKINKIAVSSNDDKRIESTDLRKDLVSEKEAIKCTNMVKRYKSD